MCAHTFVVLHFLVLDLPLSYLQSLTVCSLRIWALYPGTLAKKRCCMFAMEGALCSPDTIILELNVTVAAHHLSCPTTL